MPASFPLKEGKQRPCRETAEALFALAIWSSGQHGDAVDDVGEGGGGGGLILDVGLTLSQVQLVAVGVHTVERAGEDLDGAVSDAGGGGPNEDRASVKVARES